MVNTAKWYRNSFEGIVFRGTVQCPRLGDRVGSSQSQKKKEKKSTNRWEEGKDTDNVQASIPPQKEYQAEQMSQSLTPDPGKKG